MIKVVFLLTPFGFIYRVVCKCGSCGPERKALSEWERHTGSKAKNWKTSVKVKFRSACWTIVICFPQVLQGYSNKKLISAQVTGNMINLTKSNMDMYLKMLM